MSKGLRIALAIAVLAAGFVAAQYLTLGGPDFAFEPAPVDGFRRLAAGDVSTGAPSPLIGVDQGGARSGAVQSGTVNVCAALFGPVGDWAGRVPLAAFSDYNCPFCRVQTDDLLTLDAARSDDIHIRWHEWPVFGEASAQAARAALAAGKQGAYRLFHDRLMQSRSQVTPEMLRQLSLEAGISSDRLLADMNSPEVNRQLDQTRWLAEQFVMIGTPVTVIGSTVVEGYLAPDRLEQIVELEAAAGPPAPCR